MKLVNIYNKILLNELMGFRNGLPYSYTQTYVINKGWIIKFKSKNGLNYTVFATTDESDIPLVINGQTIYTQGYNILSIAFKNDMDSLSSMTNEFDPRVLITVAVAIKEIISKNDIQVIEFFAEDKPFGFRDIEDKDHSNSRTRVYKYIANIMKPNNYNIKSFASHVTIYQDPNYYNKKRKLQK